MPSLGAAAAEGGAGNEDRVVLHIGGQLQELGERGPIRKGFCSSVSLQGQSRACAVARWLHVKVLAGDMRHGWASC